MAASYMVKKTLHIDEKLLAEARAASGASTDTETVRLELAGSTIDAHLLASSLVSRSALYTADGPLRELAESLGAAYVQ